MSGPPPPNHPNFLGGNGNLNQIALAALQVRAAVAQQQQSSTFPQQFPNRQRFPMNFTPQMGPPGNGQPQFNANMPQQQNFGNPLLQLNSLTTGLLQLLNVPGLAAALQGHQQQTAFLQQQQQSQAVRQPTPDVPQSLPQSRNVQTPPQQQQFAAVANDRDSAKRSVTPSQYQMSSNQDNSRRYGSGSKDPRTNAKESAKTGGLKINFKSNKPAVEANKSAPDAAEVPTVSVAAGDGLGLLTTYGGDGMSDDSRSNTPKPKKMRLEEGETISSPAVPTPLPPATNFSFAFPPPPMGQRMSANNTNFPFTMPLNNHQGSIPFPPPSFYNVPPPLMSVPVSQPPYGNSSGDRVREAEGKPTDSRKRKYNRGEKDSSDRPDRRVVAVQQPIADQPNNSQPVTFRCRVMPIVPLPDDHQMASRQPRVQSQSNRKGNGKSTKANKRSDSDSSSKDSDDDRPQRYRKSFQDGLVDNGKRKQKGKEIRKAGDSSFSSEESDTESIDGQQTKREGRKPRLTTPDSSSSDGEKTADDFKKKVQSKASVKLEQIAKSDGEVSDSADNYSIASTDLDELGSDISETEEEEDEVVPETRLPPECWMQTAPAKLYFNTDLQNPFTFRSSAKLQNVQQQFEHNLAERKLVKKSLKSEFEPPPLTELIQKFACHHDHHHDGKCGGHKEESSSSESSGTDTSESEDESEATGRWAFAQQEISRKLGHPDRLHQDLWFNEADQSNDGPLCRCSWKSRKTGIRHGVYPGEQVIPPCDPDTNNFGKLFHYRVSITPTRNFRINPATTINHDGHQFIFDGFSIFSHQKIPEKLPPCRVIRYNIEYTVAAVAEETPAYVAVTDLQLFWDYIFCELLELKDVNLNPFDAQLSCPVFHVLPRFCRPLDEGGKEILSSCHVLKYLVANSGLLIDNLQLMTQLPEREWQKIIDGVKGQLVTNPTKRPTTIRIDQLDRVATAVENNADNYPVIVHFGLKPAMLTYAGSPEYQKAWKQYVKFRHLLANKAKVTSDDRTKLAQKETHLQRLRSKASLKRDVTVEVSSKGFYRTGLHADVVQHALMLPVLFSHLRFHWSLKVLEDTRLKYTFKSRSLLELALTHPSYRTNYGTNPDHARNTLTNCGMRQPQYGDARIHHIYTRKRGINTLIDIMARMGSRKAQKSRIMNNERLEYLGDAVIEFLSTVHLFFMFPDLQEGGLATYRSSLVQNRQLASLAKRLGLDEFMLYAHGPDLCHETDLRHAMANCFEAVMAALYLDGGLDVVDAVYSEALFPLSEDPNLHEVWKDLAKDPLQEQEPNGDRHWIASVESLQKLAGFEDASGIKFNHIRLLARAFTRRNVGFNFLTLGHNQRLEFLGDTVLQLVTSVYLYKHFPDHHEGHLSLLRSCLVNNKTQSVICEDLGLPNFVVSPPTLNRVSAVPELRMKDKADLLEALIGALYVDRGLRDCKVFCKVCFFPRLKYFIMTQKWNDAKSQLQQCCLTLRSPNGGEPDIPYYKVIHSKGPTNTRIYTVAVYFRTKRLAEGTGHSVQQAEMTAAEKALRKCKDLFPHLDKQRNLIEKRFNQLPDKFYVGKKHPQTSDANNTPQSSYKRPTGQSTSWR